MKTGDQSQPDLELELELQLELQLELRQKFIDLAAARLGGQTLLCSDDFFAGMENLLKPGRGIFVEDKYTDRGKWMDGWESRRSYGRQNLRETGCDYDWCIIALGVPGVIYGFDVDTNHFRGNAPAQISIEAAVCEYLPDSNTRWTTLVAETEVSPHSQNLLRIEEESTGSGGVWSHVRLKMFPDGGIARFRVYGLPESNPGRFLPGELVDLAAIKNGGRALLCSDMFFSDKNNLLMPGRGVNMGDGWETRRRRDPGPDWVLIRLAFPGSIQRVVLDTAHFKGNFPDRFSIDGRTGSDAEASGKDASWRTIITETRLYANCEHTFSSEILVAPEETFTHIKLNIYPDGGVSRLRVYGHIKSEEAT